ncbi:anthranilate synthase family protein [Streptomyces yaizuensis]|uniref:anthranilate synthase n=1 Tax=Streptomyces yaizuensis TaxID=2989713 RepID=A0ABQ5NR58_9ACTN|nr:anthranilate synthase family protein [Streptomyces sp. YSPA8]GLF92645.1 anthranilate synthase family protein [Streptomyces sp. YSPA8]
MTGGTTAHLLRRILADRPPAFALLHRPETAGPGTLDILLGDITTPATLDRVPLGPPPGRPGPEVLVLVPYRQIAERGFDVPDDGAPLLALTVTERATAALDEALALLPDRPTELAGARFEPGDDAYADIVRRVIADEIGQGQGANFVIRRTFLADITDYTPRAALAFFRRLVHHESGAYWTFIVHTGDRTLVGASPERHISLTGGTAVMNPISGTYRYPPTGPTLPGVMDFLADRKEADELYMVVDEELKMMARICDTGGRITGPYLKEMTRLAHTEYLIEGRTARDPRDILRETLFAPTVTGSPLESAARVIRRYEPAGRGYYSGVAALIGRDAAGERVMDSAILIRTADIDTTGRLAIGVGATLVRHSDPASEVAETRAKAAGLLAALEPHGPRTFAGHPSVRAALARRNTVISDFWLADGTDREPRPVDLAGRRVLVIDAEDTFTAMIEHQLRALGLHVTNRRFDEPYTLDGHDLIVMGPGPGDPRRTTHPKIAHLRSTITQLLTRRLPFIAVCLSHQVLATLLGLPLRRRDHPNQGVQREIDLFGTRERVGFYNTFAAVSAEARVEVAGVGAVEISRDPGTGEVHAMRGRGFASTQFHAESVLTREGPRITGELIGTALRATPVPTG